jgi:hypothetical protein
MTRVVLSWSAVVTRWFRVDLHLGRVDGVNLLR